MRALANTLFSLIILLGILGFVWRLWDKRSFVPAVLIGAALIALIVGEFL